MLLKLDSEFRAVQNGEPVLPNEQSEAFKWLSYSRFTFTELQWTILRAIVWRTRQSPGERDFWKLAGPVYHLGAHDQEQEIQIRKQALAVIGTTLEDILGLLGWIRAQYGPPKTTGDLISIGR